MAGVSRRQLARQFAASLKRGEAHDKLIKQLAAYLLDHHQLANLDLYVADIEAELARDGVVVADVTTAKPLDDATRTRVKDYVQKSSGASAVTLREHVDEAIIGGIVIKTSGHELDASVAAQLRQLKVA